MAHCIRAAARTHITRPLYVLLCTNRTDCVQGTLKVNVTYVNIAGRLIFWTECLTVTLSDVGCKFFFFPGLTVPEIVMYVQLVRAVLLYEHVDVIDECTSDCSGYRVSGIGYLVSGIWYLVLGI